MSSRSINVFDVDDAGLIRFTAGRCYLYVFPGVWEDHCKLGFSRDPLSRIQALHHRYFEFFDLDRGYLVETETVRDARDIELALRHRLLPHNAPAPLTVREQAGGHSEWYRGAEQILAEAMDVLRYRGFIVHAPLRTWLLGALMARSEQLYAWTLAQLKSHDLRLPPAVGPIPLLVRDTLDAYMALGIDPTPMLDSEIQHWYCDIGYASRVSCR